MTSMLYLNSWISNCKFQSMTSMLYQSSWNKNYKFQSMPLQCYISTHGSVIVNSSLYDLNVISELMEKKLQIPVYTPSMLYLNSWISNCKFQSIPHQCYISTHGSVIANSSLYDFNVISELMGKKLQIPAYMTSMLYLNSWISNCKFQPI